ncbi:MAG: hypothetical protein AB7O62_11830 [Pirellulales bacterium]
MHLSPVRACQANAGGAMTALCALAAFPWLLMTVVRGTWWLGCPSDPVWIGLALTIAGVTLADWGCRMLLASP